ncbi:aspartyl-phosphate phosphatase Spo0E family protein [Paenibacillus alvei]|uniref:aspartyl-phosphate phosphatase Spo0E family protein n=1 Tax=Paenibacillus TaxID=44249 RepID=UPI0021D12352|nr:MULTISPECIES: aspartyl-phosphate phosphatase Spo0E family protein [Paenibacillus]MCY7484246.1 aspartyl-phosphate phosphatase Spo0E family protein [Paenibacillus alvei]MCY9541775.1 aspartyl-phosphate phosphatase Spo0E family protein [Paenibacillus alvei]MCY9705038.1 aspartyl-phosphate phosphatase Spo0E family protein [Paenibacillus alvei]MCY9734714.1 aspartyl-phosphate phosphatase Spo0E family protein [Paenibacillus alvei]MCY9753963.1 aspartyl-phosphate phosphatase Spo0E family protein [Paen
MIRRYLGAAALEPFYFVYDKSTCLIKKIEMTRQKMIKAANEKESFTDEAVVRLSQELDYYLLEYQKCKLRKQSKAV